jgi:hypothetical protein
MTLRRTIELVTFALALLIAAMALHAWLASRADQQRLATTLAQQKQLLDAADARERTRQSALAQTLAQIESLKRATQTPQQIVTAIPQLIPLPQPITLMASQQGTSPPKPAGEAHGMVVVQADRPSPPDSSQLDKSPDTSLPSAPTAQIPTADLKPLYNYIQDCRSCQAQLAAATQNATDDAARIAALTKERNAAITASKGGTLRRRLTRNALWFAIGAATILAATHTTPLQRKSLPSANEYYVRS